MHTVQQILRAKHGTLLSISPDADVFDALATMARHDVGALAVLDRGRLVGMFSERDYARKVILQGRLSKDTAVSEIMTSHLVSVTPDDTVDECMRLMTEHRVRHLPVMANGDVAGMVSLGDLVKWIIDSQEQEIRHLHAYIAGAYPAA